jgi:hypothetical protein
MAENIAFWIRASLGCPLKLKETIHHATLQGCLSKFEALDVCVKEECTSS